MTIEDGMDGADGGRPNLRILSDQDLSDFRRSPAGLFSAKPEDGPFDLRRQPIGLVDRPAAAIREALDTDFPVAIPDLVSGLSGNAELPAEFRHPLAFRKAGHKAHPFVHGATLFPRHRGPPPPCHLVKCHPCDRNDLLPMSRYGHAE